MLSVVGGSLARGLLCCAATCCRSAPFGSRDTLANSNLAGVGHDVIGRAARFSDDKSSGGDVIMSTATKSKPQAHQSKKVKLQPLGDRVVVEREESEGRTA